MGASNKFIRGNWARKAITKIRKKDSSVIKDRFSTDRYY